MQVPSATASPPGLQEVRPARQLAWRRSQPDVDVDDRLALPDRRPSRARRARCRPGSLPGPGASTAPPLRAAVSARSLVAGERRCSGTGPFVQRAQGHVDRQGQGAHRGRLVRRPGSASCSVFSQILWPVPPRTWRPSRPLPGHQAPTSAPARRRASRPERPAHQELQAPSAAQRRRWWRWRLPVPLKTPSAAYKRSSA